MITLKNITSKLPSLDSEVDLEDLAGRWAPLAVFSFGYASGFFGFSTAESVANAKLTELAEQMRTSIRFSTPLPEDTGIFVSPEVGEDISNIEEFVTGRKFPALLLKFTQPGDYKYWLHKEDSNTLIAYSEIKVSKGETRDSHIVQDKDELFGPSTLSLKIQRGNEIFSTSFNPAPHQFQFDTYDGGYSKQEIRDAENEARRREDVERLTLPQ